MTTAKSKNGTEAQEVTIEEKRLEFEKEFKKPKVTSKKKAIEKGAAFHDKSEKNSKVNLGGPGKRKPRKTAPRNRAVERKRAEKKREKNNDKKKEKAPLGSQIRSYFHKYNGVGEKRSFPRN